MADDIFTQETVDKLNASALTFNEVVTSRAGGVSTGSLIDQTLTPLGENTDTLKGRLDKIGTTFTDWGSAEGGTLTSAAQAFLNNTSGSAGFGNYYAWTGAFPHIVTPGLNPAATAGYAIRSNAKFFSAVTQTNDGASVSEPSLDDLRDIVRRDTAGYTLIGNTTIGCTVTAQRQTVKVLATGREYEWTGSLPKTVAPGEDLTADPLWVSRTYVALRNDLSSDTGSALVAMKRSIQSAIKMTIFDKLDEPVIDVREYGAIPDYILPDGTVNPSPTNNTSAINAAYIVAVERGYSLLIAGNFYCEGNVVLSHRPSASNIFDSGGTQRKTIYANCVLWFGNVGTEVQPYANSAVYVGDRSSVGVYPVDIIGMMDVRYVGSQTVDLYGFHAEHSAYGNANVVCSGFRGAGAYIDGTIYYTVDSKNRPFFDNGLDILIESSQGSGGGLRFATNLLEVRNAKLASKRKIKIQPGADVIDSAYKSAGSSIVFHRVLMEGDSGPTSGVTIDIDSAWETATTVNNGCVVFDGCWAEGFLKTNAFAAIKDSVVEFRNMFWGHGTNAGVPFMVVKDDKSRIKFNGGGAYFSDVGPGTGCVVARSDSATDAYRSNVQSERFVPIGGGGVAYPMHDGAQLGRVISYDASSNTAVAVTKFQSGYPAGNSSDYMQGAAIDMYAFCNAWFGTKWREVDVALAGTDGSSYSCATVRVTKYATGAIVQIVKDATSKLSNPSGSILAWSGTIDASWFRPTVTMTASMSVNEYGVSY